MMLFKRLNIMNNSKKLMLKNTDTSYWVKNTDYDTKINEVEK